MKSCLDDEHLRVVTLSILFNSTMVKPFKSGGARSKDRVVTEGLQQSANSVDVDGAAGSGNSSRLDGASGASAVSAACTAFGEFELRYEEKQERLLEVRNYREEEQEIVRGRRKIDTKDEYKGTTSFWELRVQPPEDILCSQDKDGDNELMLAIMKQHESYALFIINVIVSRKKSKLLNIRNSLGQAATHLAVMTDLPAVTQALVSAGVTVDLRDNNGHTPLHCASHRGLLKQVHVLTSSCSDPKLAKQIADLHDYQGWSCIHLAAQRSYVDVIEYLVKNVGADVNKPGGGRGMTPLHVAVLAQDICMILFLLKVVKANINALTYDKWSAVELAAGFGHHHLAEPLIKAGASPEEYFNFDKKLARLNEEANDVDMD